MAGRPEVKEGLGEKSQFKQFKMETKSHKGAEFEEDKNIFDIEIKCPEDVRSIFNLFHYDSDGMEKAELKNGVYNQMKGSVMKYKVAVNETGWYKLNLFATPASTKDNSLPCVYTYRFLVKKLNQKAYPYPKQFADWKKDYYLHGPKFINPHRDLSKVKFEITVPDAKKVAVKVGDEWVHLEKKGGGKWEGNVDLSHYQQQASKGGTSMPLINVNACTGSDESSYATLLQYHVQM